MPLLWLFCIKEVDTRCTPDGMWKDEVTKGEGVKGVNLPMDIHEDDHQQISSIYNI